MASTSGGKAAVRLAVQKEVFTPAEERLLGLTSVTKPGRRRKVSFLCVSGQHQPFIFSSSTVGEFLSYNIIIMYNLYLSNVHCLYGRAMSN